MLLSVYGVYLTALLGLVILCDAMRECLWRLKDINDTLNNVMMGNRARMISHDIPWGEDNGQVRATRASVDISPIRVRGGGSDVCAARFRALIGWTYDRWTAARLGRTSGSSI